MPPRHVPFEGPVNFRDIGGYESPLGSVRWGRVYRSDTLNLTDADLGPFAELGVRTVYDLRSEMERRAVPDRFPPERAPTVHVVPLVSEDPADNPLEVIATEDGEGFLEQLYRHILDRSAKQFAFILTGLADEAALPAVYHCSAGKDRTGLVSGVLLSILGVPLDTILDDYEMTGLYRTAEHVQASMNRLGEAQKLAPEVVAGILSTPRRAMQAALAGTAERYGDFDRYLVEAGGADPSVPGALRAQLLA